MVYKKKTYNDFTSNEKLYYRDSCDPATFTLVVLPLLSTAPLKLIDIEKRLRIDKVYAGPAYKYILPPFLFRERENINIL